MYKETNLTLNLLLIDLGLLFTEVCMQGLHSVSAVFKLCYLNIIN